MWLLVSSAGDLVSIATTSLTIAASAGLGLSISRINALRSEVRDEREGRASDRLNAAADEVRAAKAKADAETTIAQLEADKARLTADIDTIRRLATGQVHWDVVSDRVEEIHGMSTSILDLLKSVFSWLKREKA